jgi:hypothetical protein
MGYPSVVIPNTQHTVWYSYAILMNGVVVGSLEKIGAKSDRVVERIREINNNTGAQVIDMVWGGTDTTLDLSRVELYTESLLKTVGSAALSLETINLVFDIFEQMKMPTASDGSGGGTRNISYEGCVPKSWGRELESSGSKVIESMTVEVSRVWGSYT